MAASIRYIRATGGKYSVPMEGTARDGTKVVLQHLFGDTALLEMYVIDVGQGDAVLLRFPDGRHVLVDGGYGKARIILTGDLNTPSQRALLDHWAGQEGEFECDVAKACRHGSDDVSLKFLEALNPAVSLLVGRQRDARSSAADDRGIHGRHRVQDGGSERGKAVQYLLTKAGALRPQRKTRALEGCYVVGGIVYGLVNVRTDGTTILCATRNEGDASWKIKTVPARF